jgi:integrase
VFAAAGSCW